MFDRIAPLALACMMSGFTSAATAQAQQTADGAQRFLALLAKDDSLSVGLSERNGNKLIVQGSKKTTFRWLKNGVPDASDGPYGDSAEPVSIQLKWLLSITRLEGMDDRGNADSCTTRLDTSTKEKVGNVATEQYTFKKETFFGFDYLPYLKTVTDTYEDPAVKFAGPHHLAWGKAVISRAANGRITARSPGARFNIELVYGGDVTKDAEMTDRVEFAMKFLKASCDKTAATGF